MRISDKIERLTELYNILTSMMTTMTTTTTITTAWVGLKQLNMTYYRASLWAVAVSIFDSNPGQKTGIS
eukprot:scaffold8325_cov31-Prasinocladus_malaysianus.AAC.2